MKKRNCKNCLSYIYFISKDIKKYTSNKYFFHNIEISNTIFRFIIIVNKLQIHDILNNYKKLIILKNKILLSESMSDKKTEDDTDSSEKTTKKKPENHSLRNRIIILICLVVILIALLAVLGNPFSQENLSSLEEDNKTSLSVTVTGDVMFGRKMPGVLSQSESPYRYVSNVTNTSDILLVNTENPFTTSGSSVKPDVPLKASPDYIDLVNGTQYTVVVATANNHIYDYGLQGLTDTIENLDARGIRHVGSGQNKQEATAPVTIEKNGYNVTIFNYMDSSNFQEYGDEVMPTAKDSSPGYSAWNDTESPQQIQQAKNNSDFVIVYMHYGNEYSRSPNTAQEDISHKAIDAGADTVLGAHPHVTQGIEMYNGKPIFYSLGNFIFDQSNSATHRAYFVNFQLSGDNVTANVYPINLVNYLPHYMSASDGQSLLKELNPHCDELEITDQGTGKITFQLDNKTSENDENNSLF